MPEGILSVLSPDQQRALLARCTRRRFARGEMVFHRGDPADCLHLVIHGRFAVRVVTPLGDEAMLDVISPGGSFGELALLGPDPKSRSASVSALSEAETRALSRSDFDALRRSAPALERLLTELLAAQVRRLSERLVEALYLPSEARVRRRLDELCREYQGVEGSGVTIPLTQEEIAHLAGVSRLTVSRVIAAGKASGTLSVARGRLILAEGFSERTRPPLPS